MTDALVDWQPLAKTKAYFGIGARNRVPSLIHARKTLLVTTEGAIKRGTINEVLKRSTKSIACSFDRVKSHYSLQEIDAYASELNENRYECILAIGGGSVIDTAKCFSILINAPNLSLLKLVTDSSQAMSIRPIPIIAVPTTSGSGSEVTPFATVWNHAEKKKHSLSIDSVMPHSAVIDPSLTLSLPIRETLSSGLDAISHAFESIWNVNATPKTLSVATQALRLGLDSITKVSANPRDLNSRTAMSKTSLLGGIAISHTRTAFAHSASYPLTTHLGIDHGFACSIFLPAILNFNSVTDDGRLAKLAQDLGHGDVDHLSDFLHKILEKLRLKQYLKEFDLSRPRLENLKNEMINSERADNNMRKTNADDVLQIIDDTTKTLEQLGLQN